jgi:transposase
MGKHQPAEYKEYVAKLVVEEGRKISDLAYELEISQSTISRWSTAYREKLKAQNGGQKYITPKELKKLEQEYEKKLNALQEENEILKKAMHIFTKNQA